MPPPLRRSGKVGAHRLRSGSSGSKGAATILPHVQAGTTAPAEEAGSWMGRAFCTLRETARTAKATRPPPECFCSFVQYTSAAGSFQEAFRVLGLNNRKSRPGWPERAPARALGALPASALGPPRWPPRRSLRARMARDARPIRVNRALRRETAGRAGGGSAATRRGSASARGGSRPCRAKPLLLRPGMPHLRFAARLAP